METVTVPLGRGGVYGQLTVEFNRLPHVSKIHVWNYGVRQLLNDAIADKEDDDGNKLSNEALVAKAQRRLDMLYSGELRVRRETAEPVDPVERIAHRMAWERLKAIIETFPEWKTTNGKDRHMKVLETRALAAGRAKPERFDVIEQFLTAHPDIAKAAAAEHRAQVKAAENIGIEL